MTSLDQKMNEGIDRLIVFLEQIKEQQGFMSKAQSVAIVAEEAKNYADYWNYKLDDWATD